MLNKMLLSLYDYYRRKNDPIAAAFHTKVLFSVFLFIQISIILVLVAAMFNFNLRLDERMNATTEKVLFLGLFSLILVIVWFSTDSYRILEIKRPDSEFKYRKYFLIGFYISIPILIYVVMNLSD